MKKEKNLIQGSAPAGRYANILLDYWFKRTFGTEPRKRLLELFLKELIPEREIAELRYEPQEHLNPWPESRDIRVDVECTDTDGTRFVVEMQLARQEFFYERSVLYTSFAVQEQSLKGGAGYDFPTVYFIGITDFSIHEGSDQVSYRYMICDPCSGELMTDRVQYIFLELPNYRGEPSRNASTLENICYALHNLPKLKDRPNELEGEIFRMLFESAEIATFAPEERIKYEQDMRSERDYRNQIRYASKRGAEDRSREIALRMLKNGLSVETIEDCTGLSQKEISSLK